MEGIRGRSDGDGGLVDCIHILSPHNSASSRLTRALALVYT